MPKKLTTEEFIEKAKNVHGDFYDYGLVNYINTTTKVKIICREHGIFQQTPEWHLAGQGCLDCGFKRIGESLRLTKEEYIKKANSVHNDKYSYHRTEHRNMSGKIIITCSKHGDFTQTSGNHLSGNGCPSCNESKGEALIAKILDKNNIRYAREYKIPQLKERYEYDFYLPDYNLLIEHHGVQHYQPVEIFGGKKAFDTILIRDRVKKELAKAWNYRYLPIKHTVVERLSKERFEEVLLQLLKRV